MKKKIVSLLLVSAMSCMLFGCGEDSESDTGFGKSDISIESDSKTDPDTSSEYANFEYIRSYRDDENSTGAYFAEYVDKKTGVHYFVNRYGITPRYDSDGSVYVDPVKTSKNSKNVDSASENTESDNLPDSAD